MLRQWKSGHEDAEYPIHHERTADFRHNQQDVSFMVFTYDPCLHWIVNRFHLKNMEASK